MLNQNLFNEVEQIVISASRRTDIPAFYMDWFMERIDAGFFEIAASPYKKLQIKKITATPDKVHTIVFWSKNFSEFLKRGYGENLKKRGFNLFFQFTINSESKILEPNVLKLEDRIDQLKELALRFGAESIIWRFDPICFYLTKDSKLKNNLPKNNLNDFSRIAERAAEFKITRCVTSFLDMYKKIKIRTDKSQNIAFVEIDTEKRIEILLKMEKRLAEKNISLLLCCEKKLLTALPSSTSIKSSSCIPSDLLVKIYGGDLSLQQDKSQRIGDGCKCMVSCDIGSYALHPCFHNCLFCYANPAKAS